VPTKVKLNAFIGKKEQPSDAELTTALGPAKEAWQQLLSELAHESGITTTEWKSYSIKWGWSLRVKRGKRTIIWLSPFDDCFEVTFIFGAKAMTVLGQSKLPKRILTLLSEAKRYPEGTALRLQVRKPQQISVLKKLVAIKVAN
jgi:hypothetical protein